MRIGEKSERKGDRAMQVESGREKERQN